MLVIYFFKISIAINNLLVGILQGGPATILFFFFKAG